MKDLNKRKEELVNNLTLRVKEKKGLKASIENVNFEKKVVEKKITNSLKQIEKLKESIAKSKETKEALALEIVDLQQGKL